VLKHTFLPKPIWHDASQPIFLVSPASLDHHYTTIAKPLHQQQAFTTFHNNATNIFSSIAPYTNHHSSLSTSDCHDAITGWTSSNDTDEFDMLTIAKTQVTKKEPDATQHSQMQQQPQPQPQNNVYHKKSVSQNNSHRKIPQKLHKQANNIKMKGQKQTHHTTISKWRNADSRATINNRIVNKTTKQQFYMTTDTAHKENN